MKHLGPIGAERYVASGRERLRFLAAFLETVHPDSITFSRWFGGGKGCAVGLAAVMDPRMQAQGLGLANEDSLKECRPVYQGKSDWEAVTAYFDISHQDATLLFTPAGYHGELRIGSPAASGSIWDAAPAVPPTPR